MSVDHRCYCGPFIRCRTVIVHAKVEHYGCINPACKYFHIHDAGVVYCPSCGTRIGSFEVEEQHELVNGHEIMACLNEVLRFENRWFEEGNHCFTPNARDTPRQFLVYPKEEEYQADLTEFSQRDEMTWLEQKYSEELDVLRNTYGKNNVEIRWGVFIWSE